MARGSAARRALLYRRRQGVLAARLVRQIVQAWRDLAAPDRIDDNWPALRSVLAASVREARRESAELAREFYLEARREAGVPGEFRMPDPPELSERRLLRGLDVCGPIEFKRAIAAGKRPDEAIDAAAVRLAGSMQYLAMEGGRGLVDAAVRTDERATGYARVTDNDPCSFCAMLASRGPVYKSAKTAGDPRGGGDRYHDACGCVAVPAFTLKEDFVGVADRLYEDWLRVTRGKGGQDARNVWRRWWDSEGRAAYTAPGSDNEGG